MVKKTNLKLCPFHNCLTCSCYNWLLISEDDWNTRPIEDALTARIAELEMKIRHNALWQASEDAEERAHLEKLVPDLKKRIAELEAENAELKERVAMLDVTAVYKSLGEMGYIEQVTNLKAENAALQSRIAELEKDNDEFRQLIRDWSIVLEQNDEFQLWHVESVRQAMLEINKECEE